ncbi:MAG: exosortase/archaeosortase family protein [Aquabacterium sp.]
MSSQSDPRPWQGPARVLAFAAIFIALHLSWQAAQDTAVRRWAVDLTTVPTATWLLNRLDPTLLVTAVGARLQSPHGGIQVINGCDGIDVLLMTWSAMLVIGRPMGDRLLGLLLATGMIFALNVARVSALFLAARWSRETFDILHGTVTPLLLVAGAAAFTLYWSHRGGPHAARDR